jgi:hypothetical protein
MGEPDDKFQVNRTLRGRWQPGAIVTRKELKNQGEMNDGDIADAERDKDIALLREPAEAPPPAAQPIDPNRAPGTGPVIATPSGPMVGAGSETSTIDKLPPIRTTEAAPPTNVTIKTGVRPTPQITTGVRGASRVSPPTAKPTAKPPTRPPPNPFQTYGQDQTRFFFHAVESANDDLAIDGTAVGADVGLGVAAVEEHLVQLKKNKLVDTVNHDLTATLNRNAQQHFSERIAKGEANSPGWYTDPQKRYLEQAFTDGGGMLRPIDHRAITNALGFGRDRSDKIRDELIGRKALEQKGANLVFTEAGYTWTKMTCERGASQPVPIPRQREATTPTKKRKAARYSGHDDARSAMQLIDGTIPDYKPNRYAKALLAIGTGAAALWGLFGKSLLLAVYAVAIFVIGMLFLSLFESYTAHVKRNSGRTPVLAHLVAWAITLGVLFVMGLIVSAFGWGIPENAARVLGFGPK